MRAASAGAARRAPLPRLRAERVLARIAGGSSSPVLVQSAGGRFLCKLRGAAQGPGALAAEVLVGEIAEALGLCVPERVILELEAPVASDDRNDELADLLQRSLGSNVGLRWLEGASVMTARAAESLDDDFAVRVLWLDALVMNPDRTVDNVNVMSSRGQPWLIDHGAALSFQYDWARVSEDSPREQTALDRHLFGSRQHLLPAWDGELARRLTREVVEACVARVPDALLSARPPEWSAERARAAFFAFLWKRLAAPRPFVPPL